MKTLSTIIPVILFIVLLLNLSCNRPDNPVPTPKTGLDAIDVPEGFTFTTSEDVNIQLQVNGDGSAKFDRAKFFIYSGDPDSLGVMLASGGVDENGFFQTIIPMPIIIDSLYISSNITGMSLGMVAIEGNTFSYQFSFSKKSIPTGGNRNIDFTDVISDFENGLDGWTPYRDNSIYTSDAANTPITVGPMGSSDKFIWGFDTRMGIRSFLAPVKFSGNIYGQYIAYHYYLGNTEAARPVQNYIADIRITDGNKVLAINLSSTFQHEVNAGWQTIYAKLDETENSGSGWRIGNMSTWTTIVGRKTTPNKHATDAEIQQILQNATGILMAPEYQNGSYGTNGPEFIALGKVGIVSDVTSFPIIQQGEEMDDSDNDGVPNSTDDYPEDPTKAYNNYSPGEGVYGTLVYEDLWPRKGDYDFNDLVVDFNINVITNASNKVVEMDCDFVLNATGAGYLNAFAFELPVNQSTITQVSGQELADNIFTLNSNGTEAGQTKAVIIVFDDAHTLFNVEGFINTDPALQYYDPESMEIQILFDGSFEMTAIGTAPYNPFIVANQQRGYEIHLAGHENSALADLSLFGTDHDDSNPSTGKYYQTTNNLPWAIQLPVSFDYPVESASIETAYLKFVDWAESGGSAYSDWYLDNSGYRNNSFIYSKPE